MHEMSLAMQLIEIVDRKAREEGGLAVSRVEVELGNLAGVMAEALEFCFEAAARDTLAEKACLTIIPVQATGRCQDCAAHFPVEGIPASCPACGQWAVEIKDGQELRLKAIHIEE